MQTIFRFMGLPLAVKVVIFWLPLAIVAFEWFENDLMPLMRTNSQRRIQLKTKKNRIRTTKIMFKKMSNNTGLSEQQASVQQFLASLPNHKNLPTLIKLIYEKASLSGVEVVEVTPKVEDNFGPLLLQNVFLKLSGTYGQILGFVGHLSEINPILNIASLEITQPDKASKMRRLDAELLINSYSKNDNSKVSKN